MVYEPLYHAREIAAIIKLSSGCSCKAKSARSRNISLIVFNKTIIPLALLGYEMIKTNSALRASLVICHLKYHGIIVTDGSIVFNRTLLPTSVLSRKRIGLISMAGVYIVLVVGMVIAFLALMAEIYWKRSGKNKIMPKVRR